MISNHTYTNDIQTTDINDRIALSKKNPLSKEIFSKNDCKRYIINLDAPPEHRWDHVIADNIQYLPTILTLITDILGDGVLSSLATLAFSGLTKIGKIYYNRELEGISKVSGIPVGKIALMQIAYEVFAACTSIVVNAESNQVSKLNSNDISPFHIRTMDWDMMELQALTIEVEFVKDGTTCFIGTTWAGYIGILTGMKPQGFSISINYRRTEDCHRHGMLKGVIKNMVEGIKDSWPVSFLVREALTTCVDYDSACSALRLSSLMAPTYITVAGILPNQGTIITRDRDKEVDNSLYTLDNGPIVQANMDHFRSDEVDINLIEQYDWQDICNSRHRRNVVLKILESMKQDKINKIDLWLLLSCEPCLAYDTVYTVSMHPLSGEYITRVQITKNEINTAKKRWMKIIKSIPNTSSVIDRF